MAYGAWLPWATLLALTANIHRDPKKRRSPVSTADFHPLEPRKTAGGGGIRLTGALCERLGDMFAAAKEGP